MAAKAISREAAPAFVCELLQRSGAKGTKAKSVFDLREQLSARVVAKALGQTTGFLYHHWGSFDAFLFEVSGIGWKKLVDSVVQAYEASRDARTIVQAYVAFAVKYPVLYWLLAERPLSAATVRATLEGGNALPSFNAFLTYVELITKVEPGSTLADARAMHAAAHGLASQLLSLRLGSTPDALRRDELAIAEEIGDVIAARFFPTALASSRERAKASSRSPAPRSPARDPRAASHPRQRTSRPDVSSRRSSRKRKSGS